MRTVWVKYVDGKLELDAPKVKVVRRLIRMALDGMGLTGIATKLNAERVPVMGYKKYEGRTVVWSAAMVHKIITSRALLGEFQPFVRASSTARDRHLGGRWWRS